jgi:hypothetical protein
MAMEKPDDILFGKLAVAHRIVTPEQLADCVSAQTLSGEVVPIGQIMLERQIISQEELDLLLRLQREGLERIDPATQLKREAVLYGRIVVREGFATQEEVNICLRAQALDGEEGRSHHSLGEIMVEKGYLTTRQMGKILEVQKTMIEEAQAAMARSAETPAGGAEEEEDVQPYPSEPSPEPEEIRAETPAPPPPRPPAPRPPAPRPPAPQPPAPPPRAPAPSAGSPPSATIRPKTQSIPTAAQPPRPASPAAATSSIRKTSPIPTAPPKPPKKLQCPICEHAFMGAADASGWIKCPECGTGFSPR